MFIKNIKVKGFRSYIDEMIDFEKLNSKDNRNNIFAIIGQNGHGKSSIIEMITTCLFYRNSSTDARGIGMEELINRHCDHFEIDMLFLMNDNEYRIIRRKSKNGDHELFLYINNSNLTEKISETQNKINNIVKMDYDTFMDTICVGQGQSGRFMHKKPNERKDVFVQILNLDKYEKLKEYTNSLKKEVKNKIDSINMEINRYSEQLGLQQSWERNLLEINNTINTLNNKINIKEEEYQSALKERLEYESHIKAIEDNKKQYEELKKYKLQTLRQRDVLGSNIKELQGSLIDSEQKLSTIIDRVSKKESIDYKLIELDGKRSQLEDDKNKLSNQINTLNAKNSMLHDQLEELKKKYNDLKNYNDAQCQFCGNAITLSHKESHLAELKNNGKLLQSQITNNKNEIETLNNNFISIQSVLEIYTLEILDLQKKQNYIITAQAQIESLQQNIENNIRYLNQVREEYSSNLQIDCSIKEYQFEDIQQKTFQDLQIKREKEALENQYKNEIERRAQIELKIREIEAHQKKVEELNIDLEKLTIEFSDYEDLEIAWGKAGIQAVIIENSLPEIELEINNILEVLCDGQMSIEFRTQKENKGKKSKKPSSIETLDIIINDEFGARTYETYSGGEKFRVDFACHVGLAKFLANRAGSNIDFFIVDEGLGSQDSTAVSKFVTSVHKLTNIFKQIFVITHIEEVKESFENKILIIKDPLEGSKLKYI